MMLKRVVVAAVLTGFVVLTGCTSNKYCLREEDYQSARSLPPIVSVDDLQVQQATGALIIPGEPAKSAPYGVKGEDGDGICLDQPPRIDVVSADKD